MKKRYHLGSLLHLSLFAIWYLIPAAYGSAFAEETTRIVVNQVGYKPGWDKVAFLLNADFEGEAAVIQRTQQDPVAVLPVSRPISDDFTGDRIQEIDFTAITEPGSYVIRCGELVSPEFEIRSDVFNPLLTNLLRAFYLQRCGVALDDTVTGLKHKPCHRDDATLMTDPEVGLAAPGGWHSDRRYGKSVTRSATAVARLLDLYQQLPQLFTDSQLSFAVEYNRIPDLLDETKVGIDWLLTMQRTDGGVYDRIAPREQPSQVAPDKDTQKRFVHDVSRSATAEFAAVMAMASGAFSTYYPLRSQDYLDAATKAWRFLQSKNGVASTEATDVEPKPPQKNADGDVTFWCATELLLATDEAEYSVSIQRYLDNLSGRFEPVWARQFALRRLLSVGAHDLDDLTLASIRANILQRADQILIRASFDGYRLAVQRFVSRSNQIVCEEAMILFFAYQLTSDQAYRSLAQAQLHYILGRNHFGKCFITAIGDMPVENLCHPYSSLRELRVPGFVIGGPITTQEKEGRLHYVDDRLACKSNSHAVDYNASLISLLGFLLVE